MKKVLIIEDDPVTGMVYQRFLTKEGFNTELAKDGAAGLERVIAFAPDVILLDLMMPKVSGLGVLKALRAQEQFRTLPILVLTNACVPAFVEQATADGANKVCDKSKMTPFLVTEMLHALFKTGSFAQPAAAR